MYNNAATNDKGNEIECSNLHYLSSDAKPGLAYSETSTHNGVWASTT